MDRIERFCRAAIGWEIVLSVMMLLAKVDGTLHTGYDHIHQARIRQLNASYTENKSFKSDDYPRLPKESETRVYHISTADKKGYLRMIFDDLDLPQGSILQIYDGSNKESKLLENQPHLTRGSWHRPVVASSGSSLFIIFVPTKNRYNNVGFKATYWATNEGPDSWTQKKPFTDCPPINDAMDGGEINLVTVNTQNSSIDYQFDCVWQLKYPHKGQTYNSKVFLKVLVADLGDGTAEIHSSTDSESSILFTFEADRMHNVDNLIPFQATYGFYMRVKKPTNQGKFQFRYGVYEEILDDKRDEFTDPRKCTYHLWKESENKEWETIPGYRCQSNNWCIPKDHTCDTLPHCPDNSDEQKTYCNTTSSLLFAVGNTIDKMSRAICRDKLCDDGSCIPEHDECPSYAGTSKELPSCKENQKVCITGKCVADKQDCGGNCSSLEYKCDNGMCVNKRYESCNQCKEGEKHCKITGLCLKYHQRCPEMDCPNYKPWYCKRSLECLYWDQQCDGILDCKDGSDEDSDKCNITYSSGDPWWQYILWVAGIACIPVAIIYLAKSHKRSGMRTPMWGPFASKKKLSPRRAKLSPGTIPTSASRSSFKHPSPQPSPRNSPRPSPKQSPIPSPKTSPSRLSPTNNTPYGKGTIEIKVNIVPGQARTSDGYLLAAVPEEAE